MDAHIRNRTKSKSASIVFKKDELKEAGIAKDPNQPPSPRETGQNIPGYVPEEWKYGRVQRDSIKEGIRHCTNNPE